MKVLLYLENMKMMSASGIGRAIAQQQIALKENNVEFTLNKKDSYDIANINSYTSGSYHLMRKLQKNGYKVIVHAHSTHEDLKNSFRLIWMLQPFYNLLLNRMYSHADLILTPTPYSKSLVEKYKGVNTKIIPISNGIDLKAYEYNQEYVDEFKKYFSIKEGQKVVIGVGFYFKRKGIDDFFEVARKFPTVKFIWFGHLSKILTSSYINRCIRHKPRNCILPGYIKGNIIKGAYSYASCMLFPTREETEGIVTLEALASKCPLIVRDHPVFNPWLENNVNCYKGNSIEEFTKLVEHCLNTKDQNIVNNGYQVAKQRDLKIIGEQLKKIYEDLLQTKTNK